MSKLRKPTENGPFCFKIKRIPNLTINEGLVLMYEEAFFLNYGLDCLRIQSNSSSLALTPVEVWSQFVKFDRLFPFKYACYHNLRSKGWVIKCGLKYGCDFCNKFCQVFLKCAKIWVFFFFYFCLLKVVYYGGPDRYHASYAVRVVPIDLSRLENINRKRSQNDNMLNGFAEFTQFSSLIRINETVSKVI